MSGIDVKIEYGPAGLLRERIETGEPCALFASANREHPQNLLVRNKAVSTHTFAGTNWSLVSNRIGTGWIYSRDPTLRPDINARLRPFRRLYRAFFDNMDVPGTRLGRQTARYPTGWWP